MKEKRYADVDAIQNASTAILNAIPKDDLKKSFDNLLDSANRCIQCEGDYFEGDKNKMFAKENQYFVFFIPPCIYSLSSMPTIIPYI